MNIYLDIETIPAQPETETKAEIAKTISAPAQMSKPETIAEWHNGAGKYAGVKDAAIEEQYRKTSFDGAHGEIISLAYGKDDGFRDVFYRSLDGDERGLLTRAFDSISESLGRGNAVFFVGHNIPWDLKFIWQRAVILRVAPPFEIPYWGRHGSNFWDNMQAWAGYNQRVSQENLCKAFGIEGKPDDIDGSKVWDFVKRGDVKRVSEYNLDDIEKVIAIYNRIKFIY